MALESCIVGVHEYCLLWLPRCTLRVCARVCVLFVFGFAFSHLSAFALERVGIIVELVRVRFFFTD